MKNTILFGGGIKTNIWLSNFSNYPIVLTIPEWSKEPVTFKTAEHLYQFNKCYLLSREEAQAIIDAPTPYKAKRLGRSCLIRPDWDTITPTRAALKLRVMYRIIQQKITQHPELEKLLIATEDAYLQEYSKNDNFWAGEKNWLGKIWMFWREVIKKTPLP